jgi:hypothetical protein
MLIERWKIRPNARNLCPHQREDEVSEMFGPAMHRSGGSRILGISETALE